MDVTVGCWTRRISLWNFLSFCVSNKSPTRGYLDHLLFAGNRHRGVDYNCVLFMDAR